MRKPSWAQATVATAVIAVSFGALGPVAAGPSSQPFPPPRSGYAESGKLPDLDPALLRDAISGLPNDKMTGALLEVSGDAGRWSGTAGVERLGGDRGVRPDGRFRIGSATKIFTATVALQLAGEGKLKLRKSVQHYLPGLLPRRYPRITIGQLLNHTSGLPFSEEDVRDRDPRWYVRHRFEGHTPREVIATATDDPMAHRPGAAQRYNGVNYFIAGMVIEKVSGRSYAHEVLSRIIRPLGLQGTRVPVLNDPLIRGPHAHGYLEVGRRFVDISEQSPYPWAEGGMISTSQDLTRVLHALFRGELLPRRELREVFTVPDVAYVGDDSNCSIGPDAGKACYSVGLTKTTLPNGVTLWGKSGAVHGYTTAAFATRDLDRVMVYNLNPTSNKDGSEAPYVQKIIGAVFDPGLLDR